MKIEKQFRTLSVREVKTDKETRTLEFPFSSELPVTRWFGKEVLSHKKGAADLARLNDGGALLWNHNTDQVIGVVESADLRSDKRIWAKVKFSENAKAQEVLKDIEDGILKNVSFGYQIEEMELSKSDKKGQDEYTVTKWLPFEVSIVSIPADHSVGIGRSNTEDAIDVKIIKPEGNQKMENEKNIMEDKKNAADIKLSVDKAADAARENERSRAKEILSIGEKYGKQELARQFVDNGKSVDELRNAVLESIGHKQTPITGNEGMIGMSEKEMNEFSFMRAVNALANPHDKNAQEAAKFEREVSIAAEKKGGKTSRGIMVPFDILNRSMKRDLVAGTPSAGGYLVGTDHLGGSFIELLRNKQVIQRLGATTLNGLVGNISIPKQSGAATAYWVGENVAPTEGAQTLGQVAMSPKTIAAYTDMSRKLMAQSSPSVEQMVKNDLSAVLALAIDYAALYGSGSANQPLGLFGSGVNTVDFTAAAPTFLEVISMESQVAADNADVGALSYLTNALGRGLLKGTVKDSGSGQYIMGENGLVNGYKLECSNQVLTLSSTDPDFWFGNWADLMLAFWSGLDLMVDPYTGSKEGTVRIVAFQDVDVAVRHAESFCYGNKTI